MRARCSGVALFLRRGGSTQREVSTVAKCTGYQLVINALLIEISIYMPHSFLFMLCEERDLLQDEELATYTYTTP